MGLKWKKKKEPTGGLVRWENHVTAGGDSPAVRLLSYPVVIYKKLMGKSPFYQYVNPRNFYGSWLPVRKLLVRHSQRLSI